MQLIPVVSVLLCASHVMAVFDKERAMAVLTDCKEKTHAPEDIADMVVNHKFPSSPEGKCMLHCVLEAKGLMKGDHVDVKAFSEYFEEAFAEDQTKLATAAQAVAICSTKLAEEKGLDKCEMAARVFQCGYENNIRMS